jgi:hypothetical protein
MDAAKETGVSDSRAVYTPPCVVRISDLKQGAGLCASTGSGDAADCNPNGNTATGDGCRGTGNSARADDPFLNGCSTGNGVRRIG